MSDHTPLEALARAITAERMRHYGYTDEQLARLEAFSEADHVAAGCFTHTFGWTHDNHDSITNHGDLDELDDTADFVMFVLESKALAAHDAETREKAKRRVAQAGVHVHDCCYPRLGNCCCYVAVLAEAAARGEGTE